MNDGSAGALIALLILLGVAALLACIPATIASGKGRSYGGWWLFGLFFFLPAVITALLVAPTAVGQEKHAVDAGLLPCPLCAEYIRPEAVVCRWCQRDLPAGWSDEDTEAGGDEERRTPHNWSSRPPTDDDTEAAGDEELRRWRERYLRSDAPKPTAVARRKTPHRLRKCEAAVPVLLERGESAVCSAGAENGLLVVTEQRVLFLHAPDALEVEEFTFGEIVAVQQVDHALTIRTADGEAEFATVPAAREVAQAIDAGLQDDVDA